LLKFGKLNAKSKERAKRTGCLNNLKQFGTAMIIYSCEQLHQCGDIRQGPTYWDVAKSGYPGAPGNDRNCLKIMATIQP
jgi:hypothetical protein